MPKRLIKCEIRYRIGRWAMFELASGNWVEMYYAGVIQPETKAQFIKRVTGDLIDRINYGGVPGFSLRIKGRNGRVMEERTFGPDPKMSKG